MKLLKLPVHSQNSSYCMKSIEQKQNLKLIMLIVLIELNLTKLMDELMLYILL